MVWEQFLGQNRLSFFDRRLRAKLLRVVHSVVVLYCLKDNGSV